MLRTRLRCSVHPGHLAGPVGPVRNFHRQPEVSRRMSGVNYFSRPTIIIFPGRISRLLSAAAGVWRAFLACSAR